MLGNDYNGQICSIAAALEVVGERWSLLIVREVFLGVRRFDEMQADLGIARNVLQTRLTRLVEEGVLEKRLYQERPARDEDRLTEKGLDLWPTIVALMQWGDRWIYGAERAPIRVLERETGAEIAHMEVATPEGKPLRLNEAVVVPGPGADESTRRRLDKMAIRAGYVPISPR
jgi:DNA-binding HxlR family transcriptional regulator